MEDEKLSDMACCSLVYLANIERVPTAPGQALFSALGMLHQTEPAQLYPSKDGTEWTQRVVGGVPRKCSITCNG